MTGICYLCIDLSTEERAANFVFDATAYSQYTMELKVEPRFWGTPVILLNCDN